MGLRFILVLLFSCVCVMNAASVVVKTDVDQLQDREEPGVGADDEIEIIRGPVVLPERTEKETPKKSVQKRSTNPSIRLVGGSTPREGRVEILKNGQWGTICDNYWDSNDAKVACRQLGLLGDDEDIAAWPHNAKFGQGTGPILMKELSCRGTETSLDQCSTYSFNLDCTHGDDAGVVCKADYHIDTPRPSNDTDTPDGQIRLVGDGSPYSGILQVFHKGVWGMVCDDNWNTNNGHVVCRQLGLGSLRQSSRPYDGQTGVVWLDEVWCEGTEDRLEMCSHRSWGYNNCNPGYEAVSIMCNEEPEPVTEPAPPTIPVRLVDGSVKYEGRVEVLIKGTWGTVCDSIFQTVHASAACRQLGYPSGAAMTMSSAFFGQGEGPIALDYLYCRSNDQSLSECQYCDHSDDVGVICKPVYPTEPIVDENPSENIRLVGSTTPGLGRVEVNYGGVWGQICDDNWDQRDGDVVCRQHGFGAVWYTMTRQRGGTGPVLLDDVTCLGTEKSIQECSHRPWMVHDCHAGYEGAGVRCHLE